MKMRRRKVMKRKVWSGGGGWSRGSSAQSDDEDAALASPHLPGPDKMGWPPGPNKIIYSLNAFTQKWQIKLHFKHLQ